MEKNNYKKVKLVNVTKYLGRGVSPSYSDSGTLVLNQKCIRETVTLDEARHTDSLKKKISEEKYLQQYDVVICSTGVGTLGRVGQIKEPITNTTVDSHVTIVRPNLQEVDPIYLGYLLKKRQKDIEFLAEGSTGQIELPRTKLNNLELSLPPLSEQHRIASILSSFDNKIELLRKENNTLENIAQSIFKEWFVKYNFPNKDGKPYRDNNGKMIDSELGLIPEGWRVGKLGELVSTITKGTTPTTIGGRFTSSGVNFIKAESIDDSGNFLENKFAHIDDITNKLLTRSQLHEDDILYSIAGTISRLALVSKEILPANTNQAIAIIRPNKSFIRLYLYSYLKQSNTKFLLNNNIVQAVQANLSLTSIRSLPIVIPLENVLQNFDTLEKSLYSKVYLNNKSIRVLQNQKNFLLSKLFS